MAAFDPKQLDNLAQKLAGTVPAGLQSVKQDMERNFRGVLEGAVARMDLVTREEFEVQQTVLARTREKVRLLEAQVRELERRAGLDGHGAG